jgi:FPC/CPF motif-containing protein YcgG
MLTNVKPADLQQEFFGFLEDKGFPCVGAKSAHASKTIETFTARDIRSAYDDLAIHQQLSAFSASLKGGAVKGFRSFAVLFQTPRKLTEQVFDALLWERLQSLRDKDRWLSYQYDPRVERDPRSPDFAFSIGGEGYFVVGMHPGASRASRRTPMPILVFNPFAQFEQLREEGRYDRMSQVIRARDEAVCGSPNPMLANHGDDTAAKQFSGRLLGEDWVCPLDLERRYS